MHAILLTSLCTISSVTAAALPRRSINNGMELKFMPLGASITRGYKSTSQAGYRPHLNDLLEHNGNPVTFVGSVSWGNMTKNLVEGHPGYTIQQVTDTALDTGVYDYKPNVVLLNAGTNDCNIPGNHPETAPERYAKLLNDLTMHVPDATVIASSLLPNLNDTNDECTRTLNEGLHQTAKDAGVLWVDMYNVVPKFEILTSDSTHPTNRGYEMMAEAWYEKIIAVGGHIKPPCESGKEVKETVACFDEVKAKAVGFPVCDDKVVW